MDIAKLKRLAAAVIDWANCSKAWFDTSEDVAAAVVGHIDYDGNTYPVAVVDCDQYYSGDSLALANFYAAANPAAVLELIAELERLRAIVDSVSAVNLMRLQAENERLRAMLAAGPKPDGWRLVPEGPTPEMVQAGWEEHEGSVEGVYLAMLAAAPKPEGE